MFPAYSSSRSFLSQYLQRGVVYYLDDQSRIIGIVLWNATDLVERARELIRRQALELQVDTSTKALKRKIPLAPDSWLTVRETPAKLSSELPQFGAQLGTTATARGL